MSQIESYASERVIQLIQPDLLADVIQVSTPVVCYLSPEEIYARFPKQLTPSEIDDFALRVNMLGAKMATSGWNETKYGNKAELNAVGWLGLTALYSGDFFTTDSAITHLRTRGWRGKTRAFELAVDKTKAKLLKSVD